MTETIARERAAIAERMAGAIVVATALTLVATEQRSHAEPPPARLTIAVRGAPSDEGVLRLSLANSREIYESDTQTFRGKSVPLENGSATVVFEDLPSGTYAVKTFHDMNANEKIDIGWMGPEEAYGFSNDARGLIGPPDFDDAKFELSDDRKIEIRLK